MKNKLLYPAMFILGVLFMIPALFLLNNEPKDAEAGLVGKLENVIGSRTASSTTAVNFYKNTAGNGTTTKAIPIGSDVDSATFSVQLPNASSTGYAFNYFIWGSNDNDCATASTTSSLDRMTMNDINWYPIDPTNTRSYGTITTATTSSVLLTNLNWSCLRFDASASSTQALVQMRTKVNQ